MSYINIIKEIENDIDWRIKQLISIKTIPIRYNFKEDDKEIYLVNAVPAIYAIWEGFVKESITKYSRYLNGLLLKPCDLAITLLTHAVDENINLNDNRSNWDKKEKMITLIDDLFSNGVSFKHQIPTKSNVDFATASEIMKIYCLKPVLSDTYKDDLNKLLHFRNKCAHGDNAIKINSAQLEEFTLLVEHLMYEFIIAIENSLKNKLFRR